ncbi:hypothetical protein [Sandaracinus amylolyticus]|uniref:HEAT repeat domain-containing protein n=1 Tax=Sandaracinus amylolyticus TaxID=927083 RepID=A0A0F6W8Q7_9BACT|nr:hypothetical protein [Sandaracinus amylolyticus]AKF10343.1 hypothetical protein DB32_007492 [Sandaracinus amylolyticus]
MHLHVRSLRNLFTVLCSVALLAACAVTHEDVDTWIGTVRGPGKIKAVLLSDKYDDELRIHAGLALVRMERQDVEGVTELQSALRQLDDETRRRIVDGMTPGLLELMRGEGQPQQAEEGPPPTLQVRAKDAAFLVLQYASPTQQGQLTDGVVGWFVEDFNGRSLAGNFSAEQVVRQLGAPAAQRLVDAMNARIPQQALVKIAELVAALGSPETKTRAAERLVAIEREMEGPEFGTWLGERIRTQLAAAGGAAPDDARVQAAVALNREQFITTGALPAMHHLADQPTVSNRLLEMATQTAGSTEDRRVVALQAMEGHVRPDQNATLLALALDQSSPVRVRDYAFDRIADSRAREAIPQLWPLATSADNAQWRQRWRVGSLILTLGGPEILPEWLGRLPNARDIQYAREELNGYATRIAAMRPEPDALMTAQLASPNWWNRAIALYYFERQGDEADLPRIQAMAGDTTATRGEHWEEHDTVGKIAQDVVTAIRERMTRGAAGAGATGATGAGGTGGAAAGGAGSAGAPG